MTDIFFSYSSADRVAVRRAHSRLKAAGYDVSWDQVVPPGKDWDSWIRDQLGKSSVVIVFWSRNAVASENVRHEATIARRQNKLIPVMLEALDPDSLPMGQYMVQAG
jgi:hypothetical protein